MDKESLEAARAVAFHFIEYAPRSKAEVERRLTRGGYDPLVIETIVRQLTEARMLDDAAFAVAWVADRADRKGYGKARLTAELRRKGVAPALISEALGQTERDDELRRAMDAAQSRLRREPEGGTEEARRRKLAGFLQRRGFEWNVIAQVLRELTQNQD